MAFIMKLQIVADIPTEYVAEKLIRQLLNDYDAVVDVDVTDIKPLEASVEDAIVNETYESGEAFAAFIYYSPKQGNQAGNGFWSNEYGWTTRDLASRFSMFDGVPKYYDADDVEIVPDNGPVGRFFVGYHPDDQEAGIQNFQCWADSREDAIDHAYRQSPGIQPVNVDRLL